MAKNELDGLSTAELAERALKGRRDALAVQIEEHDKRYAPLRKQIDDLLAESAEIDKKLAPLLDQWRPANVERARLQNEHGIAARATGGKSTSTAPSPEAV